VAVALSQPWESRAVSRPCSRAEPSAAEPSRRSRLQLAGADPGEEEHILEMLVGKGGERI